MYIPIHRGNGKKHLDFHLLYGSTSQPKESSLTGRQHAGRRSAVTRNQLTSTRSKKANGSRYKCVMPFKLQKVQSKKDASVFSELSQTATRSEGMIVTMPGPPTESPEPSDCQTRLKKVRSILWQKTIELKHPPSPP